MQKDVQKLFITKFIYTVIGSYIVPLHIYHAVADQLVKLRCHLATVKEFKVYGC